MRLALLISDPLPLPVFQALRTLPEFSELLCWTADDGLRPRLREEFPSARFVDRWDALLTEPLDAVLICGVTNELQTAARHLAQRGLQLLVLIEATTGPARLFDFMTVWQEHPQLLIPVYLSGVEQAADFAFHQFQQQDCGTLWKLEFRRVMSSNGAENPLCSPERIDRTLLQDLHWICRHTGLPQHVTMQVSGPAGDPAEIIVLLGGAETPEVRWTLTSHLQEPEHWSLELRGSAGVVSLASSDPVTPEKERPAGTLSTKRSVDDGRTADLLRQLQQADQPAATDPATATAWLELIQLAEIGAVARRSLLRRRTLDAHFGEASERSQFKSQMTALGCGALLWTMFGMISLLVLGGLADPRDREYRQSAAAGFVFQQELFEHGHRTLTPVGHDRIRALAAQWSETTPVLIVEESSQVDTDVNRSREEAVVKELAVAGVQNPEQRLVLRPLRGEWFEIAMRAGWVLVFAPLAIVLLLQLLILASREPITTS